MLISYPLKHPWPLKYCPLTILILSCHQLFFEGHLIEINVSWGESLEFRLSTFLGEGREAERRNDQPDNQTFVLPSLFGLTSRSYLMFSVWEGWIFCPNHLAFDVSVTPILFLSVNTEAVVEDARSS